MTRPGQSGAALALRLVTGLCLLALAACYPSDDPDFVGSEALPSGHVVPVPEGFVTTATAEGLILTEAGDTRAPRTLEVAPAGPTDPAAAGGARRDGFAYRQVALGSGSGGTEWELVIDLPGTSPRLAVTARLQTEARRPDFDWAWAVARKVAAPPD